MSNDYFINRKALAKYEVVDRLEAGVVLTGSEVKAVREGRVNMSGSYVTFLGNRPIVVGLHINRYSHNADKSYDPDRSRFLLLNSKEIDYLAGKIANKGYTAVPLNLFFKRKRVKIEIGIVKGKKIYDRREELKERDIKRDLELALKGNV